jgi:hypothetical protein
MTCVDFAIQIPRASMYGALLLENSSECSSGEDYHENCMNGREYTLYRERVLRKACVLRVVLQPHNLPQRCDGPVRERCQYSDILVHRHGISDTCSGCLASGWLLGALQDHHGLLHDVCSGMIMHIMSFAENSERRKMRSHGQSCARQTFLKRLSELCVALFFSRTIAR